MLTLRDPRGIVWLTNEYDAGNRVIRQTFADATTYQFAYTLDGNGKITQVDVTDPRGYVRRVTLNAKGYILTDTAALGQPEQQTKTYERDVTTNQILAVTDALGRRTTYSYDPLGNVTSVARLAGTPDAVTTTYSYEPTSNQVTSITDPLNHTTSFTYDSRGALATMTSPLNTQTVLTANAAGQPTSIRDPLNNTTQLGYDFGDLVSISDPLGNLTRRFVDGAGRLTAVTDPRGWTTRYEYNALNRLTRITDAKGGATAFTYDGNGNLLSVTDPRGSATTYTYNNMDRLITRTDPLTRQESYLYDNNGNPTQFSDRKSQATTFGYDRLNRRTQASYADTSTTTYTYDGGNRLTAIADSLAGTISRTYDSLDRLTQETTPQGSISYTYDASGHRSAMTVAGQPAIGYGYDSANRLTSIAQGIASVAFAYDADARRTSLALPNGTAVEYAYDTASRLTGLTFKLGAATLGTVSYTYDLAGNRTQTGGAWARTNLPASATSSSYNANNQQLGFGAASMSYDWNGNLTTLTDASGMTTHTWNARNQLAGVSGPAMTAGFGYDALGRRQTKTVNGARTDFLYDRLNPVQEGILPAAVGANLLTGLRVDEFFMRTDVSGPRSLLPDALGSTLALTDSSGAVATEYTYEPFGGATVAGAANGNAFQFTGRENDGTGLYYYRARYYRPSLHRFISEDSIGFRGGINQYAYVGNSPARFRDPRGLFHCDYDDPEFSPCPHPPPFSLPLPGPLILPECPSDPMGDLDIPCPPGPPKPMGMLIKEIEDLGEIVLTWLCDFLSVECPHIIFPIPFAPPPAQAATRSVAP